MVCTASIMLFAQVYCGQHFSQQFQWARIYGFGTYITANTDSGEKKQGIIQRFNHGNNLVFDLNSKWQSPQAVFIIFPKNKLLLLTLPNEAEGFVCIPVTSLLVSCCYTLQLIIMTTTLPCVSLLPKLLLPLLFAGSLLFPRTIDAQTPCECTNCPQFMEDLFVGDFNLTVQGATNPTLGQNGQGVCGVIVHWDHTAICDISITLTSPSGQAVVLVGPIGQFCTSNGNAGTDWNVTFLPCNDPAVAPDPGFTATWNNNQNWGANNNYTGSYYPFSGCLQNFSGPVNGNWTLTVNDGQANDVGNLIDYEIIFCDPSGIDCFTCAAEAGALPQADVIACKGDPSLNLSLPPTYTAQQVPPPPAEYTYTYIVTSSSGVILAYDDGPDLSGYAAGTYTICGLSYYTANQNLLPNPNGTLTITQLNNQLMSGSPPFCGDISSDCVGVTIKALPPNVQETGEVCAPNCYVYYGQDFCTTGTHTVDLELDGCPYTGTLFLTVYQPDFVLVNEVVCAGVCSQNPSFPDACTAGSFQANLTNVEGCDSIVLLNLVVINVNAIIQQPVPSLGCTLNSVILQGAGSTLGAGTTYLWSASNGGNITGPATNLNTTVDAPGDYQLLVCRNQGGAFCCDSVSVTVISSQNLPAVPVLTGEDSLCLGQTTSYQVAPVAGAASYTWTVPANVTILSGQNTDSIQVTWNSATGGNICVTANNACGSSAPACFAVSVDQLPVAVLPLGDTVLCAGDTVLYTLSAAAGVVSWNWQISGGTLLSGNGTDSVLVVWDGNLPSGTVCAVAAGNCGLSPINCINVVINTPPAQPVMSGDSMLCAGTMGNYSITALNGASGYFWTAPSGVNITSGQNTTAISVDWTAAPGGNVCVTASGVCGAGPQQCFPVTVLAQPVADAGAGGAVCSLQTALSATTSTAGSSGIWTVLPGAPGTVIFSDFDSVQTAVSATVNGLYAFQWTETNGMCSDSDTVQVVLNASPQIGQIQSVCDGAGQFYTVSFSASGGLPPYTLTGGTWVNNTFTSDPIASGQPYAFTAMDTNGCSSVTVSGNVNCNCTSDAGTMDQQLLTACPGGMLTAQQQGGVLDANDVGAFVLHTNAGNSLGTVLAQNTTGTFGFGVGMSYGTTYYISYLVGDNLNGMPDPNDPCLSVAQGQPVVFYDNPVADAGADDAGCGLMLPLGGNGGFNAVIWMVSSAPAGASAMVSNPLSPIANLTVDQFGMYTLTYMVISAAGCLGSDDVVLNFYESPDAGAVSFQCDGANLNYTVEFPIVGGTAPYTVNGAAVVGAVFQSSPVPTGDVFNFVVTDVNGCVSPGINGTFNCNCATNAGTMVTAPATFCAGQPATADWNNDASLDADDGLQYILHSDAGATLGTVYATNGQPLFNLIPPLQTGVTYYISAIAGNSIAGTVDLTDPCLNITFGTPVQWRPLPTASLSGDTSYCAGGNATLYFTGTGMYPLQITYTSGGGTPSTVSVPGPQTVVLPVSPTTTTMYLLVSVSDGMQPVCTVILNDPATVSIIPDPVADAGQDQSIGCVSSAVTLGGPATSTGAGVLYEWSYQGAVVGTSKQLPATNAGTYNLLVTNAGGCTAIDAVTVTIDQTEPMAHVINVREITCYGDNDGSIVLDSIVSAHPPVLFSLNGGPYGPSPQFFPLGPDTYVISLQDAAGCEWSTGSIVLDQPVEVLVDLGADVEITLGNDVTLTAQTNLPLDSLESVVWNPLLDTLNAGTLTQRFTPYTSRIVTLTVTDQNGCTDEEEVLVVVQRPDEVFIPNVIKPGTGINERLVVFGGASVAGIDYLRIYDRWGGQVYEDLDFLPNDYSRGWDGMAKGKNASPGVYVFYALVRYVDGTTELVKGDVTVMW